MVRAMVLGLVCLMAPATVRAQAVDWHGAGGDLFGRAAVSAPDRADGPVADAGAVVTPSNQPFADLVRSAADRHGLDPKLLHAVIVVESGYRRDAMSPVGAGGLTQLMPATALELGVNDRFDPVENVRGGAAYLARQILRFGDVRLALAAYNAGPGRVARLGRIPDIPETQAYVGRVVDCYLALTAGQPVTSASQCQPRSVGR
jgi:soluble lytic murein transglycosylase-like protein